MILPPILVSNSIQIAAAAVVAQAIKPYAPVAFRSGGDTYFDGSGTFLVNDARAWNAIWDRHVQNESFGSQRGMRNLNPAPEIDFNNDLVVAMFAGPTRGVLGYRVVAGYQFGKAATVRLAPVVDDSRGAAIAIPMPWVLLVLPRTSAKVTVQVPGNGGWTTVATVQPSL